MTRRTKAQEPRFYWRGQALGGSSTVNAQIAIRGVPAAFDAWAEAGCEGWAASDVLPLFDAIEDDDDTGTAPGIRRGGPLPVYRAPPATGARSISRCATPRWRSAIPRRRTSTRPTGEGVSCNPINSRDGLRVTTNDGYLEPARGRPNLEIRGGALVDRVMFEGKPRASACASASAMASGRRSRRARSCCPPAPSIRPAILMRSGIGPAAQLATLGIPVAAGPCRRSGAISWITRSCGRPCDLKPEHRARGPDARHTNCCVTYSQPSRGRRRAGHDPDRLQPPGPGRDRSRRRKGAIGVALYDAFSRGELRLVSADPEIDPVSRRTCWTTRRSPAHARRRAAPRAPVAQPARGRPRRRRSASATARSRSARPRAAGRRTRRADARRSRRHPARRRHLPHERMQDDPRGVVDPDLQGSRHRAACASATPRSCPPIAGPTCTSPA